MKKRFISIMLLCSFLFTASDIQAHGFAGNTLVVAKGAWKNIKDIYKRVGRKKTEKVFSYNPNSNVCCDMKKVKFVGDSETNCYCQIKFDTDAKHDIVCTPSQLFFLFKENKWKAACELVEGDVLFTQHGNSIEVSDVVFSKKKMSIYLIEVKGTHNFFVGYYCVLTHNMAMPIAVAGFNVAFGSGAAAGAAAGSFFGPVTLFGGLVLGGIAGLITNTLLKKNSCHYQVEYDADAIALHLKEKAKSKEEKEAKGATDANGAQAPGKPTEADGYFPPKNSDGKKVKNPNGVGYGWIDKKGHVWVPTGPSGHGGPHWDVQNPKTRGRLNILPGGAER